MKHRNFDLSALLMLSVKNILNLHKLTAMTFDNSKKIISLRLKLFGATVVFLSFLALTYVAKIIKFPLLGMSETFWTVGISVIYLLIAFFPMMLNYQYIFYSDDDDKIILRYFTAGIIGGRKNSVEIDKNLFSGFTTNSKFMGLMFSITLYQKSRDGIAKYPEVFISALSKQERSKLIRSLNMHVPK